MKNSYTCTPLIDANGTLRRPMQIILKEPSAQPDGTMGPRIQLHVDELVATMPNIVVSASTSGKMTTHLFLFWLINVFFPNAAARCLLLLDS